VPGFPFFRGAGSPSAPPEPQRGRNVGRRVTGREIWSLTWPQALTMFFQFTVGFTDVVVAGRINPHLQGALGIITQCQFLLLVLGVALINGGLAAVSQAAGAGLHLRAERYVGLLLKGGVAFSVLTVTGGYVFAGHLMRFLHVPEEIFDLTLGLWKLLLPVLPAGYLSFLAAAVFRAHKNVRVPLMSAVMVCIVNAVGDLGLGLGMFGMPQLGADGIVLATLLSMSCGALFSLFVMVRAGLAGRRSFAPLRWEKRALPYVLKVALPSGGSQFLWQLGYIVLFMITGTLPGDKVTAVDGLTAGMRVEGLLFMPAVAFGLTASILIGHCLGAGNPEEARRVGLRIAGTGALVMSFAALCLYPFLPYVTAFVAPDPAVRAVAADYILFNLLGMPFSVTSVIMSGIFSGAGATIYSMAAFSAGTWLVRLPLAWYMGHVVWQDAAGVFAAMLVSQIVQSAVCLYCFFRRDWSGFASTAGRFNRSSGAHKDFKT
jgi:MATE family multidrug resistance protein